eukprot:3654362-Rhodomonas_salina.1
MSVSSGEKKAADTDAPADSGIDALPVEPCSRSHSRTAVQAPPIHTGQSQTRRYGEVVPLATAQGQRRR